MADTNWLSQIKRGLLEICILNLVDRERVYGYQLAKRLSEIPGLVVSVGTIYPLLSRLKREGMLAGALEESAQGPARRVYRLTPAGRRRMKMLNESWREISNAVDEIAGKGESDEKEDA